MYKQSNFVSLNLRFFSVIILCLTLGFGSPAAGQLLRQDCAQLNGQTFPCVYQWSPSEKKPQAVVVALHGMILHGLSFESLAKHLAQRGIAVVAPDLRGYGRWYQANHQGHNEMPVLAYDRSRQDIIELIHAVKAEYPDIPLYCLGESLGAGMALFAAAQEPSLVDGLILSSPAIKRRLNLVPQLMPQIVGDTAKLVANPNRQVDLVPYIKSFASDDPRTVADTVKDPLVRKKLTVWDLLRTANTIKPTLKYAEKISSNTPVLVIQGSNDKMLCSKSVVELLAHLNCADQTVKWFQIGHLMLETAYIRPDIMLTVDRWLDDHIDASTESIRTAATTQIAQSSK